MSVVAEKPDDDVATDAAPAPAEASVDDAQAPQPDSTSEVQPLDDLDKLLREFDEGVGHTDPASGETPQPDPAAEVEQLLAQLAGHQRQATESASENYRLQQEREGWKGAAENATAMLREVQTILWREGEQAAFSRFADELQKRMPDHVPSDYAEAWLRTAASKDQTLAIAWDARNTNPMAIQVEIDKCQRVMVALMSNPMADKSQLPALEQYWTKLQVAARSKEILSAARGACLEEARKAKPIDEEVTADIAGVVASLRSGANGKAPVEKAPWLGGMTDQQFAEYKRQFGF